MYEGATRTRSVDIFVDGVFATTWQSSGTTDALESIDISGVSGEIVEISGLLAPSEWLSIHEVQYSWTSPVRVFVCCVFARISHGLKEGKSTPFGYISYDIK